MNRSLTRSPGPRRVVVTLALPLAAVLVLAFGLAACSGSSGLGPTIGDGRAGAASPDSLADDDGVIGAGEHVSIFDEHLPTIAKLEPGLREAVQAAATAAEADGIPMVITSGWRSARYQQALLDEATIEYGSLEEARKWVATPEGSAHVTGEAVDIGFTDANSWLSQHGADYGLGQIYANEMWHFELATEPGGTCPEQRSDAAG